MFSNPFEKPKKAPAQEAPKRRRFEYILTDYDRKYVETGLKALKEDFETVPEKDFPDLLIFMDTGARPLAAGVLPIAKAVAEQRGLDMPQNRFLAGGFRDYHLRDIEALRESGDPDWKEKYVRSRIEREKSWRSEDIKRQEERLAEIEQKEPVIIEFFERVNKNIDEEISESRAHLAEFRTALADADVRISAEIEKLIHDDAANKQALEERLRDILQQTKAKHITIVDDYLCDGVTLGQVLKAFQSLDKEQRPKVTFMSFFAKTTRISDYEVPFHEAEFELHAEGPKKAWLDAGFQVLLPNQEYNDYSGFIYSHKPFSATPDEKEISQKKKAFVGVEKIPGEKLAKVSEERDQELMLQLRHEMKEIAGDVLRKKRY